jgi:hypothetical protein
MKVAAVLLAVVISVVLGVSRLAVAPLSATKKFYGLSPSYSRHAQYPSMLALNRVDQRIQRMARRRRLHAMTPRVFIVRQGPCIAVVPFPYPDWHAFVVASTDPRTSFAARHVHMLEEGVHVRLFARPTVVNGTVAATGGWTELPVASPAWGHVATAGAEGVTNKDADEGEAGTNNDEGSDSRGLAAVAAIQRLLNILSHTL